MALLVSLVLGAAVAAANYWALTVRLGIDPAGQPEVLWALVAAPVALALVLGAIVRSMVSRSRPVVGAEAAEPAEAESPDVGALRLLALLQEEGRLIDFLMEAITPYSDEQIGAATRDIHDACARALTEAVDLEPVLVGTEESEVTIEAGFDPATVRLTGNVSGEPPFTGMLRHAGWRVKAIRLPGRAGIDPVVVAPAEVEIA